jgi:hypothetical protein
MIPDKLSFAKGQVATLQLPIPAPRTFAFVDFDFTRPDLRWIDDPNGQKVSVISPVLPAQVVTVMGTGAKTPYNSDWSEQDARLAFMTELGLPIPAEPTPEIPVEPIPAQAIAEHPAVSKAVSVDVAP